MSPPHCHTFFDPTFFFRRKLFAILRNVALRLYFKQSNNSGLFTFPLKSYKLMLVLSCNNWEGKVTFLVSLYALLKDEVVAPTVIKYATALGATTADFKFNCLKDKKNLLLDLNKPLSDKLLNKEAQNAPAESKLNRCIATNVVALDTCELTNFTLASGETTLNFLDDPKLCKLVLRVEMNGKKPAVQHLLVKQSDCMIEIIKKVGGRCV